MSIDQNLWRRARAFLLLAVGAAWLNPAVAQSYVPVPVTGYNNDSIAEFYSAQFSTTAALDGDITGYVLYSQAYGKDPRINTGLGLPDDGQIVNGSRTYQLQPFNSLTNVLKVPGNSISGLSLAAAQPYKSISLLGFATNGDTPATVTFNFTDSSQAIFPGISVLDWLNGSGNVIVSGFDRTNRTTDAPDNTNTTYLDAYDIDLTCDDQAKWMSAVAVTNNASGGSGQFVDIFAVSGVPTLEPITGSGTIGSVGATTTLSDATPGGVWSTDTPSVATVDSNGVVTGVAPGTATISYTLTLAPCGALVTRVLPVLVEAFEPVATTGYNVDGIAEAVPSSATTTGPLPLDNTAHALYSAAFGTDPSIHTGLGLPDDGSIVSGSRTYQLQPYADNNVLAVKFATAKLDVVNPQFYSHVSLLGFATEGDANATFTLGFTDNTTAAFPSVFVPDWFDGGNNVILFGFDRVNRSNDMVDDDNTEPNLYVFDVDLACADQSKLLNSITIANNTSIGFGPYIDILAVSAMPTLAPITGSGIIANVGNSTTLSDVTNGGVWDTDTPSVATVDSNGVVTGVAPGAATISYTLTLQPCGAILTRTKLVLVAEEIFADGFEGP